MGALVNMLTGGSSTPAPPPPPKPPGPSDADVQAAAAAERLRQSNARGAASTILTSGTGASLSPTNVGKKTLLGGSAVSTGGAY